MTPKDKNIALVTILDALYEQYPLPGNPDNPRKAKGIKRAKEFRDTLRRFSNLSYPPYYVSDLAICRRNAKQARIPVAKWAGVVALLYG